VVLHWWQAVAERADVFTLNTAFLRPLRNTILLSWTTRIEWSTISKAFTKSLKIAAQHCFDSRAMATSFRNFKVTVTHL
jgi:hypothetical protein